MVPITTPVPTLFDETEVPTKKKKQIKIDFWQKPIVQENMQKISTILKEEKQRLSCLNPDFVKSSDNGSKVDIPERSQKIVVTKKIILKTIMTMIVTDIIVITVLWGTLACGLHYHATLGVL